MNIFYLDKDPAIAARYHCDKHVVKMILETAQLLSTAHHVLSLNSAYCLTGINSAYCLTGIYKKTHSNHPCAKWVRNNDMNYSWTSALLHYLLIEYTHRYGREHSTTKVYHKLNNNTPMALLEMKGSLFTEPPQCMPDEYKVAGDSVAAYRNYYRFGKKNILTYKNREIPEWIN